MAQPTEAEINDVLNKCMDQESEGGSAFPGMSYEQGVKYAIDWMQGEGESPLED